MAMVVKNNMSAVRTLNTLNTNSSALQKSLAKVSSGMKINSAQDDASGYAISERMRVQIRSLDQANQNTQNASSLMKTAEGAVSSTVEILKSLKEKAINAATDTNTDADRATIQKELDQFIDQIDDNALTTFNGKYLVDGSKSASGAAVATALTNQSLAVGTSGETRLTALENRNNESLEISSTDYVTASYVMNGETYTYTSRVGTQSINDVLTKLNNVKLDENAEIASGSATTSSTSGSSQVADPDKDTTTTLQAVTDAVAALETAIKANGTDYSDNMNANAKQIVDNWLADATTTAADGTVTLNDITTYKNNAGDTGYDDLNDNNKGYINDIAGMAEYTALTDAIAAHNTEVAKPDTVDGGDSSSASSGTSVVSPNPGQGHGIQGGKITYNDSYIGQSTADDPVYTADGTSGLTVTAAYEGIGGQISALSFSITDSEGNVKKSANAALDAFKTTIYAKNKSSNNEMSFQVGASANQSISVSLDDMRSEALGLKGSNGSKVSVATQDKANAAVAVFDNAIQKVLDQQATIGAVEARLEYTSQNLTTSSENVQAAESTIRDADMAKEMTTYTKNNVLLQAAQSMLAQANQNSSAVLSLLQ